MQSLDNGLLDGHVVGVDDINDLNEEGGPRYSPSKGAAIMAVMNLPGVSVVLSTCRYRLFPVSLKKVELFVCKKNYFLIFFTSA